MNMIDGGAESSGGRTAVVGVKLDEHSRELITWTLVNIARPGDRVIALHVLSSGETVDRDGKSSLFSLVKAFDSILDAYEGFCNLKQIDLKLKICRGFSVKKVLVREAKSYNATEVIVGTAKNHHLIHSVALVAKYCAKKLSKDCSVLAINNGKIVYRRESTSGFCISKKEMDHHSWNGLVNALQRSLRKDVKTPSDDDHFAKPMSMLESDLAIASAGLSADTIELSCSFCSLDSAVQSNNTCTGSFEERSDEKEAENSMAMVPVQKKQEVASDSVSTESSEIRLGWPLFRRAMLPNRTSVHSPRTRQVSVVQWTMRLPNRYCSTINEDSDSDSNGDPSSNLDGESGTIVPVGNENASIPSIPCGISKSLQEELKNLHEKFSDSSQLFKFHELVSATSNFATGNVIGKGGSSQVFRGQLQDGREIAVKILKPSEDVVREFIHEIEIITCLHHKNIISLIGFCYEDKHLLLVYDFMLRGSLGENLHGNKTEQLALGWTERYRIAIGIAEALDYLHNREGQPVIHRDVKSSNILISNDYEPKLSDFGLAKWASVTSTHISCSNVAGTFGYLAPEYFMYGKVNEKIDIYAYGVVLLELLSGRKPISDDCAKGEESLVIWARPILNSEKFSRVLDPRLGSSYDCEQVERMVLAASLCIRHAPRARPGMNLVLKLLRGDVDVVKWARIQVIASEAPLDTIQGAEGLDMVEDDFPRLNLQSHLILAMLGVEEDSANSLSSIEHGVTLEDYLQGRWSRSSSSPLD